MLWADVASGKRVSKAKFIQQQYRKHLEQQILIRLNIIIACIRPWWNAIIIQRKIRRKRIPSLPSELWLKIAAMMNGKTTLRKIFPCLLLSMPDNLGDHILNPHMYKDFTKLEGHIIENKDPISSIFYILTQRIPDRYPPFLAGHTICNSMYAFEFQPQTQQYSYFCRAIVIRDDRPYYIPYKLDETYSLEGDINLDMDPSQFSGMGYKIKHIIHKKPTHKPVFLPRHLW